MLLSRLVPLLLAAASPAAAIWPVPTSITTGNTTLLINQNIAVTYNGAPVCWNSSPGTAYCRVADAPVPNDDEDNPCTCDPNYLFSPPSQIVYTYGYEPQDVLDSKQLVQAGVSRALSSIFRTGLFPWKLYRRNAMHTFEPDLYHTPTGSLVKSLAITQTGKDPKFPAKTGETDESYNLTLSETGKAALTAATSTGVLRGLETFSQLFYEHSSGTAWYTKLAPLSISDAPKFPHRGILLDVARNWYDVSHLYRTVDALAWNKMNRLHLHITDSQSWPLELPSMPEVAKEGAYRSDLTYSAEAIASLQRYGLARGVEVYLEIDMPGHIGSLSWSHPDLVVAYDAFPYQWWCAEPPCGALKLNSSAVDDFLEKLFDDLMPRVASYNAYFHVGGDELKANDSWLDPGVGTNDSAVLQPLLQKFVDTNYDRVRKHGLTPMCWEEMIMDWNLTVGTDTVVQSWLGGGAVQKLASAGHKVIDSDYNYWYLDCGRGLWVARDNGESYNTGYPFLDWCDPFKNWALIYSHDPTDGVADNATQNVLGGEVALWSELVDGTVVDGLLWPRASAAGEVLWSGRTEEATGQNRSMLTIFPRLNEWRERMLERGVQAAPVQMLWCTQADNATECSLPQGPGY